jgi:L-rhamnonate dehydratase
MKVDGLECLIFSSKYGSGKSLGQVNGLKSIVWIQIRSEGLFGYSEVYSGIYAPELIFEIVKKLRSTFLNKNIDELIYHGVEIPFVSRNGLINSVLGCIRWALYDLKGKMESKPVWSFLSSQINLDFNAYFSGGSAVFSSNEIEEEINLQMNNNLSAYKMRIGYQGLIKDSERVKKAKNVLSDDKLLLVDAIMGTLKPSWSIKDFESYRSMLEDNNVYWLEEPFHPDNYEHYLNVNKSKFKIAFGEALVGSLEFSLYSHIKNIEVFQFDTTHFGTIGKISDYAFCEKAIFATHTWGSTLGFVMNMHFAATDERFKWVEVPGVKFDLSEILSEESISSIYLDRSEFLKRPGFGLEINIEELKKYCPYVSGSVFSL